MEIPTTSQRTNGLQLWARRGVSVVPYIGLLYALVQAPISRHTAVFLLVGAIFAVWVAFDIYVRRKYARSLPRLVPVDKFETNPQYAVFVYGSLLNKRSILRTISEGSRAGQNLQCIPCKLQGWRVYWGAVNDRRDYVTRGRTLVAPESKWLSLAIARGDKNAHVQGAVIGVSNSDFLALVARERNYRPYSVRTELLTLRSGAYLPKQEVYAFLPKDQEVAEREKLPPASAFVRKEYFDQICTALRDMGHQPEVPIPRSARLRDVRLLEDVVCDQFDPHTKEGLTRLSEVRGAIAAESQYWLGCEVGVHDIPTYQSRDLQFGLRPIVLSRTMYERIRELSEAMVRCSVFALKVLAANADLAKWAGYTAREVEALKAAISRDSLVPVISRVDLTITGNTPMVFELNADSPGGMRHLDIVAGKQAQIVRQIQELDFVRTDSPSVLEAVANAIFDRLSARGGRSFAIAELDPKRWTGTYPEFLRFQMLLREKGAQGEIVDVGSARLAVDDGKLKVNEREIDVLYKRVVLTDLRSASRENEEAIQAAFNAGRTEIINNLGSMLAGSKLVVAMLASASFKEWARACNDRVVEEDIETLKQYLPPTLIWGAIPDFENLQWRQKEEDITAVREDYCSWVLKKYDGFGGEDVVIPVSAPIGNVARRFKEVYDRGWIVQRYIPHGRTNVQIYDSERGYISEYQNFIVGAYLINGKLIAAEAKTSRGLPVNMGRGGYRTGVFATK